MSRRRGHYSALAAYALLFALLATSACLTSAQSKPSDDEATLALRKQALELYRQGKFVDAMPLLGQLSMANSNDFVVKEHWAYCILEYSKTQTDPEQRIAELRRQRQEIDDQIVRIQDGELELLDASAVRDRYQQFSATARELLADFREVEANFRKLDRQLREKITGWHGGKGELLDDVLGSRETIAGSDQGKSFQAFYDFLLSQARQQELSGLLDSVHQLTEITGQDPRLRHIHYDWLDAAERTQATVRQLSEQLRRFLDDQVWFENRRVIDILRGIESNALRLRDVKDVPVSMGIDAAAPAIRLPMERPLYAPVRKARIDSQNVRPADEETDPAALFEQVYVDPEPLRGCVRQALRRAAQVSLAQLVSDHPIRQGVAELVTYLSLKDGTFGLVFDERQHEQVTWREPDGRERKVTMPRVTFVRSSQ